MNNLPVSKKVYSDITGRINTALASSPSSAAEALRIVDMYLADGTADSSDQMAMLAFNMIRAELDRAMSRSSRARERARKRKESISSQQTPATYKETNSDSQPVPVMISRRERRAIERACSKKPKRKWKSLNTKK